MEMLRQWMWLASRVSLLLAPLMARGTLLFSETFTYPEGPLVAVSGGVWNHHSPSGSGTGEVQVVSGAVFLTQTNFEDVSALVPGQPYGTSTGTVLYAGLRLKFGQLPSGAGDHFLHFKPSGASGFRARIFATTNTASPDSFRVGLANADTAWNVLIQSNLAVNTSYLLVLRYGVSNATSSLWLNPVAENSPGVTAADPTTPQTITSIALRQNGSTTVGFGNLFLDELRIGTAFGDVLGGAPPHPPLITNQPASLLLQEGDLASLSVGATGDSPLHYRWYFENSEMEGATNATLSLPGVTTNQTGGYVVIITNAAGSATSQVAQLIVNPASTGGAPGFSVLTYNVSGNGATNWSTNSPQVRAIGRQLNYLQPDVITFNEIPHPLTWEMVNFVSAFLPGYHLATNSGTDGYIRSVIASRYPILWSGSWLDGVSLIDFGVNNSVHARFVPGPDWRAGLPYARERLYHSPQGHYFQPAKRR